ncbi:hypothetical protein KQI63_12715 [bacterium]|nr:hypothetical protein [bacterium]
MSEGLIISPKETTSESEISYPVRVDGDPRRSQALRAVPICDGHGKWG